MTVAILEFKDVWKTYGRGKTESNALESINFSLEKNSLNLILGPSGSGKSTLLNIASLMDTPSQGKVFINGKNVSNASKSDRSRIRLKEIGIVYQRANLFHYLNILENVMLPMSVPNKNKALEVLKTTGLTEINKSPQEISILGEQKAALSRAMVNDPLLILADEPTGELGSNDTELMMDLMVNISGKYSVLIVSNNVDLTKYTDNVFSIKDGKLK